MVAGREAKVQNMSRLSMNLATQRHAPSTFILGIHKQQPSMRSRGEKPLLGLEHVADQVDDAVAVAPLVVVPRDELDEVVVQSDPGLGVEDARPEWEKGRMTKMNHGGTLPIP